jgi:hypothetical protein
MFSFSHGNAFETAKCNLNIHTTHEYVVLVFVVLYESWESSEKSFKEVLGHNFRIGSPQI